MILQSALRYWMKRIIYLRRDFCCTKDSKERLTVAVVVVRHVSTQYCLGNVYVAVSYLGFGSGLQKNAADSMFRIQAIYNTVSGYM